MVTSVGEGAIQRKLIALIKGLLSIESMVDYFGVYSDITVAEAFTTKLFKNNNCNAKAFVSSWIYIFGLACSTHMAKAYQPCRSQLWTLR